MTHTSTEQPEALRFTKKPVTIVASQWFKSGDHPAVRDITDSDDLFFTGMGGATLVEREKFGVIGTLESPNHLVTPGDWIITGVQGEHYPCKPDIFEATYTPETKLEAHLSAIGVAAAAPVVLPKPAAYMGTWRPDGLLVSHSVCGFTVEELKNSSPSSRFEPLYTEQQVIDLLRSAGAPVGQE